MKKQQLILIAAGFSLLLLLFFFGRTIPDNKNSPPPVVEKEKAVRLTTDEVIAQAKAKLSASQSEYLARLENSVVRGDVKVQQIAVYKQLASFWRDSMHHHVMAAYYTGESGKLENSEKNLNFAARLLLDDLLTEENPAMQYWLAQEAKGLFERSLELNPANDSTRIGLAGCYLFGNISDNPMQGILPLREITEKNPSNAYAQMMLGLGSIKSGQFDKAIDRFLAVVKVEPENLQAIFHLAETYDRMGDKADAIKWYKEAADKVAVPAAKRALEKRIKELQ